jgi:ribonuclease HI
MCLEFDYVLLTDSGAAASGSADSPGCGSCCLQAQTGHKPMVRSNLGTATNNEAECQTLIAALKDLLGREQGASRVLSLRTACVSGQSSLDAIGILEIQT